MIETKTPHRSYITTVFTCRCPRCREGKLFSHSLSVNMRKNMEMHDRCPVCNQVTDIEVGFYYGTGYVSYLLALLLTVISFLVWFLFIGFSFHDKRFVVWIIFNSFALLLLQPWLMRFSRAFWLSCFVSFDPDWTHHNPQDPERIIESEMNNW
jgi:uncharacterized protein (DUF983 family)